MKVPAIALAGAAAGALAMAALAAGEMVLRLGTPLFRPLEDLSFLALVGAVIGGTTGWLRARSPFGFLSPFGVALGIGAALLAWLPGAAGRPVLLGVAWLAGGVLAGQVVGLSLRRLPLPAPRPVRDAAVVAVLVLAGLLPRGAPSPVHDRPNVLLLTIDTLRSDRLGFTGYPHPTSPYLDRLARRATATTTAVTPIPRTLPAFVSMMTGSVPHDHGVRDNFHYSLGPDAPTLAESFRDAGWATGAVSSNPVLSHDSGVFRGFRSASDRGDDRSRLTIVRGVRHLFSLVAMRRGTRAEVITDLALDWLRGRPGDRPFLLWVHWLAPHMPYEPAPPFDRVFDPGYEGEYARAIGYDRVSKGEMTYRNPLPPRVREHAKALYDGEVATADRALGRLIREMEQAGELENTVILFTSDHGESLDEHGYFFNHGDFVYGPAANVPLFWRTPGASAKLTREPATLVDVWAMLGALVPIDAPELQPGPLFGESGFCRFPHLNDRLGWLLPREIAQSPDAVPDWETRWEEQANRAKQRFVQAANWKLVLTPRPEGDGVELFDLSRDPGERRDVASERPAETDALRDRLRAWAGEASGSTPATVRTIDEATRRRMESLGYLGD